VTYSIVARDATTGELGVGVQSRSFRTGAAVPWAEPGIGAVATQSFTLRSYGPRGLDLLREGVEPEAALRRLTAEDDLRDVRQVALVDAAGRTAVHTGASCIPTAGSLAGDGFSAQGNMLRSERVVEALAEGFTGAEGTLAERLLAALEAAEAAGGDFRGREAGALLVVSPDAGTADGPVSDLRVDNAGDPLGELRRLLTLEQALRRLRRATADTVDDEFARARAAGVDDDVARWVAAIALLPDDRERAAAWLEPLATGDERWRAAVAAAADVIERSDAG
jgi:uncharacterized Ntn-hydrolase superfamily protein